MRAVSTAASGIRHMVGISLQALVIVAIIAALVIAASVLTNTQPGGASNVLAAKGGGGNTGGKPSGGGGGSLSIVMLADANGNAAPNWDDTITFDVSTSATTRPYVRLYCYQGGSLVYSFTAGFYSGYPWSKDFRLSSQSWTGGAADCTASLIYTGSNGRVNTLATLGFVAGA
jgi:hypothetical protein